MTAITPAPAASRATGPRAGTGLMSLGALAFVGYALIFFVGDFTDSFLELGIGPAQVDVVKDPIRTSARRSTTTSRTCTSRSRASLQRQGSPCSS